jgi:hypothetical protein
MSQQQRSSRKKGSQQELRTREIGYESVYSIHCRLLMQSSSTCGSARVSGSADAATVAVGYV